MNLSVCQRQCAVSACCYFKQNLEALNLAMRAEDESGAAEIEFVLNTFASLPEICLEGLSESAAEGWKLKQD